ncbi:glycosyltransferase [Candidatus Saccharibacteria bacterium]|nr:glycosyltransferase [Candidatus Saccharibacteria bacterium]
MLLSVIIPTYNAEKYLDRCLKSVFKAVALSKVSAEVLVVDNGSTDNSIKVAKEFASKSPLRISVLQCPAKGAAAVRNFGVPYAKGEYIWFVDADDEVSENSIKLLMEKARRARADIAMMGAKRIYANGHSDYLSAIDPTKPDFKSRFVRYGAGPWQFIFKRSWWVSNDFRFKEGIIHEDMEMISSLILYTNKFVSIDKPLYTYYQNEDSVLHKKAWDPHYLDIFPALTGLYNRFSKMGALEEYHDELEWFFIWNLLIDSAKDFKKFNEGKEGFKFSREMLKKYFPKWRKNKFLRQKPLKLRLRVRLFFFGL